MLRFRWWNRRSYYVRFSALACALYLGKRLGFGGEGMKPHSLVLSFIGACLLWVGWFGFNAGSALSVGITCHQRLCCDALRRGHRRPRLGGRGVAKHGKPSVLGGISGAVAGLVAITPASGFVTPMPALLIGFAGRIDLLLHGRRREKQVRI